jgi:hypothetical protein
MTTDQAAKRIETEALAMDRSATTAEKLHVKAVMRAAAKRLRDLAAEVREGTERRLVP